MNLRTWSDGDYPLLKRLLGDPAMTTYLGGPETPTQIRARHKRYCKHTVSNKGSMYVVMVGPDKQNAGSVGYWEKDWLGRLVWETGWSTLPEFQGQGIATKAMTILIQIIKAENSHPYLHAFPSIENGPSNAICRKLGFTLLSQNKFEYPPGHFIQSNDWQLDLSQVTVR
jgi:RimJ/RimL family protein N-acetyltransferase